MKSLETYLESGILDLYVAGGLSPIERLEIEVEAAANPAIKAEIEALQAAYESMAIVQQIAAPTQSKVNFMAALDQLEAEHQKLDPNRPPVLNPGSKPEDFAYWVALDIAQPIAEFEDLYFVPVADNDEGMTAVVWIKGTVEEEVHLDAVEKFLVLEGSCMIDIEGDVHYLKAGDCLSIPKFKNHVVNVTSDIPCKLIVQRIAA